MFASNSVNPSKNRSIKSTRKIGQAPTQVEQYGDWTLEFTRKMVGSTVRRELFSVRVQGKEPFEKAFLSNLPSMGSARRAAYVAIGELALKYSNNSERKRVDLKHSLVKQRKIRQQAKQKRSRTE
ncbi:MAG: hypothetical protein COA78_15305 [Blastopirellula sp.]|nr:MAG: hypothetical protein COA78_15305 [Blastopirellula sp.]